MKFKKILFGLFAIPTVAITTITPLSYLDSKQLGHQKLKTDSANILNDEQYITVGNWQIDETNNKIVSNDDNRFQYDVTFTGNATSGYTEVEIEKFKPINNLSQTEAFYIDFSNIMNLNNGATLYYQGHDIDSSTKDPLTNSKCYVTDSLYSYNCVGFNTGKITNLTTYGGITGLSCIHSLQTLVIGPSLLPIDENYNFLGGLISLQEISVDNNSNWIIMGGSEAQQLYSKNILPVGETTPILGRDQPYLAWGKISIPLPSDSTEVIVDFEDQAAITEIEFQEGITVVNNFAIKRCYNLKNIDFSTTLEVLKGDGDTYCFAYCPNLTNIYFPDSLRQIEYDRWIFGAGTMNNDGNLKTIRYGFSLDIDATTPNTYNKGWFDLQDYYFDDPAKSFLPENFIFASNVTASESFSVFSMTAYSDNNPVFEKFINYYKDHPINIIFEGSIANINFTDANKFIFTSNRAEISNYDFSPIHTNLIFSNSQQAEDFANTYPQYLNNPQRYSTITVATEATISIDNKNDNLISFTSGSNFSKQFTATASPNIEIPEKIYQNWSIQFTGNVQSSWYSFDSKTGLLELNNNFLPGNYDYTIKCNYVGLSSSEVFDTMQGTIVCDYQTPQLDNITLTGDGVSGNSINLALNEQATISANCRIVNENNIDPNLVKTWNVANASIPGIMIDNNGQLSIPTNQVANNASFDIIYQVGTVRQTLSVTLTISYASPVLGDIIMQGDGVFDQHNINLSRNQSAVINLSCDIINANLVDPNLVKTWSLQNAPSSVSIDETSGLLTINASNNSSEDNFTIIYQVGTTRQTSDVTLTIGYELPQLDRIMLANPSNVTIQGNQITIVKNQSGSFQANCEIINPGEVDPSLTKSWSLLDAPRGMNINQNNGFVSINPNNDINSLIIFTIKCTVGSVSQQASFTLVVDNDKNDDNSQTNILLATIVPPICALIIVIFVIILNLLPKKKGI